MTPNLNNARSSLLSLLYIVNIILTIFRDLRIEMVLQILLWCHLIFTIFRFNSII